MDALSPHTPIFRRGLFALLAATAMVTLLYNGKTATVVADANGIAVFDICGEAGL